MRQITALALLAISSPVMANDLIVSHASLQRGTVPGMVLLPTGPMMNTRKIRQQLYGVDFHPGDTLLWNTKTSQHTVYKRMSPSQVLAKQFPHQNSGLNVATIVEGESWFSVGAGADEMDALGSLLFVGRFSPHALATRTDSGLFAPTRKYKLISSLQKSTDFFGDSDIMASCVPDPPPLDTD